MAIRMRRGLESELDISQAVPGEWLVSTDTRYIRMCFAPGIVLRMATYESFEEDMEEIQKILDECQTIEEAVSKIYEEIKDVAVDVERIESAAESAFQSEQNALSSANNASDFAYISSEKANIAIDKAEEAENNAKISEEKALEATNAAGLAISKAEESEQNANNAENMADISKSYAVGDTGARLGEDIDNSKYYSEIAKIEADRAKSEADKAESVVNIGVATVEKAGIVKPDGTTITVDENGTIHSVGGGTADYNSLENKPSINGVELFGNKTTSDLGITAESVGADAAGSASTALSDAKEYTNAKIDDLVNGAPSTLDTLKEISEALEESGEAVEAINQAIGNKLDKTGDSKDNTVTFTQESERSNIASNEKHSTIFGKIAKWFSDLKTVAFSGSYNDLSNKPTIPTKVSELENDSGYATDEELNNISAILERFSSSNGRTTHISELGITDLNNLDVNSIVTAIGSEVANCPSSEWYYVMTLRFHQSAAWRRQYAMTVTKETIYERIYHHDVSTWSEWVKIPNSKQVISSELNGREFSTLQAFVEATATDVTHGHMFRFVDTGKWGPLKSGRDWYRCTVQYQNRYADGVTNAVGGAVTLIRDQGDMWFGTILGNKTSGLTVTWRKAVHDRNILNTLEEITANTDPDMIASALAVKELYNLVKNK